MGLFEHWDRRNQETMEMHNELYEESAAKGVSSKQFVLIMVATFVGSGLLYLLFRAVGLSDDDADLARIVVLFSVTVVCAAVGVVKLRRRRVAWRAERARRRPEGTVGSDDGPG